MLLGWWRWLAKPILVGRRRQKSATYCEVPVFKAELLPLFGSLPAFCEALQSPSLRPAALAAGYPWYPHVAHETGFPGTFGLSKQWWGTWLHLTPTSHEFRTMLKHFRNKELQATRLPSFSFYFQFLDVCSVVCCRGFADALCLPVLVECPIQGV